MGVLLALVVVAFPGTSNAGASPDAPPSCPARASGESGLTSMNRHAGTAESTVPGHPGQLLLCRYWGLNRGGQSMTLATGRYLNAGRQVEAIASELNSLTPFPRRPVACPFDNGARVVARFLYAGQPPVIVEIRLSGCRTARNGRARAGWLSPQLARRLNRLVPLPH
jgi:hypothetical protein